MIQRNLIIVQVVVFLTIVLLLVQCTTNGDSDEPSETAKVASATVVKETVQTKVELHEQPSPPPPTISESTIQPTLMVKSTAISTVKPTSVPLPVSIQATNTVAQASKQAIATALPTHISPTNTQAPPTPAIDQPTFTPESTVVPPTIQYVTPSPNPTQIIIPPTRVPTPPPELPTPTFTPLSKPEPRFAVVVESKERSVISHQLNSLGISRFMNYDSTTSGIPSGTEKIILISDPTSESESSVATKASNLPGAIWYITVEPNVWGIQPANYVEGFHQLRSWIKAADPTARITSPSILNWEFTCLGCGGYQSGRSWFEEFRIQYLLQIGTEPQVDIWTIDVFPLDWTNLPTVNSSITIDQIRGFRSFLDSNGLNQPIWIMELGLHWGYPGMKFNTPDCGSTPIPAGDYAISEIKTYLDTVFRWLSAQPESDVGAWFVYSTYRDIRTCSSDHYAGISLFTNNTPSGNLTEIGQHVQKWAAGDIK